MKTSITVFATNAELDASGSLVRLERPYNVVTAGSFPVQATDLRLVLGFICEPADYATSQRLAIRIVDPSGGEMATLTAEPVTLTASDTRVPLGFYQVIPLNVRFPREGRYGFEILVNGRPVGEVPLWVGRAQGGGGGGGGDGGR